MPDHTPEHDEYPPQWPPPPWHNEPTARPQTPYRDIPSHGTSTTDSGRTGGLPSPRTPQEYPPQAPDPHGYPEPAAAPHYPSYDRPSDPPAPRFRDPVDDPPFSGYVPRRPTEPAPEAAAPEPEPTPEPAPAAPLTHGRGVRMTIYGIGGAIAIGLIVVIVIMAGGSFVPDDESAPSQTENDSGPTDPLLTSDGEVDPLKYADLAESAGGDAWIEWRYGPAATGNTEAPSADQPETRELDLGDGIDRLYQVGDGSSPLRPQNLQGQLGYVAADGPGVDHVTVAETTDTTLGYAPRPGGRYSTDRPELELTERTTGECLDGHELGRPVAMARSQGAGPAAHAVTVFASGAVATTGVSGAQGGTCVILPEGQVPTAVAVTPGNEFALITVWDVAEVRGRIAVVALADTPGTYGSSWPATYPGLPNPGHFGFAKLLGFVELTAMKAPTSVAVATDHPGGAPDRTTADLSDPDGRAAYAEDVATTGFAIVSSRAEQQVEWVDLTPLLSGFAAVYFEGDPAGYASPGAKAEAWPQVFEVAPDLSPASVGTSEMTAPPTAVAAWGTTAYVALGDGTVATFEVTDPSAVSQAATVELPGAASCLSWSPGGDRLVVTSRTDRSVSWLRADIEDPGVVQTLRDARVADPICAQDAVLGNADAGSTVRVVAIADFAGGLHVFRHGDGRLAAGDDVDLPDNAFEYGGVYEPEGSPFMVSVTADNV
ncbi:hypothetical protein LX16_0701 [Stackebrandtia albiflava]|uniref:Uncharacterized protein n=1 Tax=Stackebrandtia albiflava TaxID=406432 RepID=A0A562VAW4_9ACTN|nr:hypothetical protein [Stackebrandtia albiflava]TWJ15005.1 hypothetical protein LX16_0701 [Stackebrandtia albiflava]